MLPEPGLIVVVLFVPHKALVGRRGAADKGCMRILLVDDHPITREALCVRCWTGTASTSSARRPTARRRSSSPAGSGRTSSCSTSRCRGWTGWTALPRLREAAPETEVVVLTASGTEENLLAAIRGGAAGYLLKSEPPERIAEFLRGVGRRSGGALRRGRPAAARAGARGRRRPRRPRIDRGLAQRPRARGAAPARRAPRHRRDRGRGCTSPSTPSART